MKRAARQKRHQKPAMVWKALPQLLLLHLHLLLLLPLLLHLLLLLPLLLLLLLLLPLLLLLLLPLAMCLQQPHVKHAAWLIQMRQAQR